MHFVVDGNQVFGFIDFANATRDVANLLAILQNNDHDTRAFVADRFVDSGLQAFLQIVILACHQWLCHTSGNNGYENY